MKARAPVALVRDHSARSQIDGDRCALGGIEGCADVVSVSAASVIVIASPRIPTTVGVAVEFGKAGHSWQEPSSSTCGFAANSENDA